MDMQDVTQRDADHDNTSHSTSEDELALCVLLTSIRGLSLTTLFSYHGALFSHSRHFTMAGGTFNTTHEFSRPVGGDALPADFRIIPLGDIDLLQEIQLDDETYLVKRAGQRPHLGVIYRSGWMYTADIEGRKSNLTVALYQGAGAEEVRYIKLLPVFSDLPVQNWRGDVERHSIVRHPSFVQSHSLATPSTICAVDGTSLIYCKMSNV